MWKVMVSLNCGRWQQWVFSLSQGTSLWRHRLTTRMLYIAPMPYYLGVKADSMFEKWNWLTCTFCPRPKIFHWPGTIHSIKLLGSTRRAVSHTQKNLTLLRLHELRLQEPKRERQFRLSKPVIFTIIMYFNLHDHSKEFYSDHIVSITCYVTSSVDNVRE